MKAQPCYHNGHGKRQPPALVSASTSNGAGDSGMEVALVGEGSLEPDETTGRWWLPSGAIVSVTSSGQCTFDPNSQLRLARRATSKPSVTVTYTPVKSRGQSARRAPICLWGAAVEIHQTGVKRLMGASFALAEKPSNGGRFHQTCAKNLGYIRPFLETDVAATVIERTYTTGRTQQQQQRALLLGSEAPQNQKDPCS